MFLGNATRMAVAVQGPAVAHGYVSFALEAGDSTRTLLMMQESDVALFGLVGVVSDDQAREARSGVLGIPASVADAPSHEHGPLESPYLMEHDDSLGRPQWCAAEGGPWLLLAFERAALPETLQQRGDVRAIVMADDTIAAFLPRPIAGSTSVVDLTLEQGAARGGGPAFMWLGAVLAVTIAGAVAFLVWRRRGPA